MPWNCKALPGRASLVALLLLVASAAVAQRDHYRIAATLDVERREIRGELTAHLINSSSVPLSEISVVAFANRFADEASDSGVNDFSRPFVYPYQSFDTGWTKIERARLGDAQLGWRVLSVDQVPEGCAIAIALPEPLAPGAAIDVALSFVTRVPNRFGSFGYFEDQLTAIGGWYPQLAALQPDGSWAFDRLATADFEVSLKLTQAREIALNGKLSDAATTAFDASVPNVHYVSLIAVERFEREQIATMGRSVTLVYRKPRRWHRLALGPNHAETRRATVARIVEQIPTTLPMHSAAPPAAVNAAIPPGPLVIVEAPLRLHLSAPGEGMVVLSDRSLRLHWLLRPYHELALAQAIYAETLRAALTAREPAGDYLWVSQGLANELGRRWVEASSPLKRSVQDWIELFNLFAIVDRFETAPKVPFVEAFFAKQVVEDPLHEQVWTLDRDLPPGWVIFNKLRRQIGDDAMAALVTQCATAAIPFRDCARQSHPELSEFFEQWAAPLPALNYRIASKDLNQPSADGYEHTVEIRRDSSRPVREPVSVQFKGIFRDPVIAKWNGEAAGGTAQAHSAHRVQQVALDPERELIESTRADDASPPTPQVLLDTAEVEVSSTEFSFAGTVVARGRYDYRKDIALTGFYTNRAFGMTIGPRYHWGTANDENSYRHNLYGFYSLLQLDKDFEDKSRPHFETEGHLGGVGLRYEYNDIFSWDNPTDSTRLRLFTDVYDGALGSSFDYVDWGASLSLTRPLWNYGSVFAFDVFNGFSTALGNSQVPNQARYSLGGSRSIRGIDAEQELGRNIFLIRGEFRQAVYPELDLNLMDFLILRRGQIHVFVDAGEVDSSSGDIYNPRNYAVGAGVGLGFVYEFMGLYPATMYVELATRADDGRGQGEIQVLFGTRQAF